MSQVSVYSIFKDHEAASDRSQKRTPPLTLNKEAIFEGVFQKKFEKFLYSVENKKTPFRKRKSGVKKRRWGKITKKPLTPIRE